MKLSLKLLVAEPSASTRILIKNALGEGSEIHWVDTLMAARAALAQARFDGVVAALKLSDGSALELVGETRDSALVLISDEADPLTCAQALERGADDFVAAPLHAQELRARVRARIASRLKSSRPTTLVCGGLEVDLASRVARWDGAEIELTGREFGILSHLMRHEDEAISRDALIAAVWGSAVHVMDRTISTHVYTLRKKLGPVAATFIRAEMGAGYRFSRSLADPAQSA